MAKKTVTLYPANDVQGDGIVEPIEVPNIDKVSFIDNESHGPGHTFGITDTLKGRVILISSPNVVATVVDAS